MGNGPYSSDPWSQLKHLRQPIHRALKPFSALDLLVTLTQPEVISSFLECVGLSARPPPLAPAREPAQPDFDFNQDT